MERSGKIFILVVGGILIAGSITLGVVLHFNQKRKEEEEAQRLEAEKKRKEQESQPTGSTNTSAGTSDEPISDGKIYPTWNVEGELMTPANEIKGQYLYPKRKEQGGSGYSNIRSSALVNTDQGWWDPSDNLITTINAGIPIGKVVSETAGVYNGYSYRWFRVKLYKNVGFWYKTYKYGYVRADTVTHKPI